MKPSLSLLAAALLLSAGFASAAPDATADNEKARIAREAHLKKDPKIQAVRKARKKDAEEVSQLEAVHRLHEKERSDDARFPVSRGLAQRHRAQEEAGEAKAEANERARRAKIESETRQKKIDADAAQAEQMRRVDAMAREQAKMKAYHDRMHTLTREMEELHSLITKPGPEGERAKQRYAALSKERDQILSLEKAQRESLKAPGRTREAGKRLSPDQPDPSDSGYNE